MQHAGLVIEVADGLMAFRVRTDDEADGTVAVNMVVTALGIILDDENDSVAGEEAFGDRFNDPAQGEIVVSDLGGGRRETRGAAAGVIVREIKHGEGGPETVGLSLV